MDEQRFDSLARTLAREVNRRRVLRGGAAGLAAAVGLRGLRGVSAAPADKVTICHWDADLGVYKQITISANGLNGHNHHAEDILSPDFASTETCGTCGNACDAPENASATCTEGTCGFTCNEGYQPDGNGGCEEIDTTTCPVITLDAPACFWQDCFSQPGECCWNLNGFFADTQEGCQALDSCSPGGGGESGGGCYKWATSSETQIVPPWIPASCGTYIVAGGSGPLSQVNADDDFTIFVNGVPVIVDDNGVHSSAGPSAPFSADLGDPIQITATNDNGGCQGITPVVLYCATDPTISQVLTTGVPNPFPSGCIHPASTTPFFDVTVAIAI